MNNDETPEFDRQTATEMQAAASAKLQALLKAKQGATTATSSKEFAVRCVRGLETTIHQLFDVGASVQEVLAHLTETLPTVEVKDLKYALKMLRDRHRKLRVTSNTQTLTPTQENTTSPDKRRDQPESQVASKKPDTTTPTKSNTVGTNLDLPAWADGSDKRTDESDEDYRLRKEIEGPPEARHKFIGEHKT